VFKKDFLLFSQWFFSRHHVCGDFSTRGGVRKECVRFERLTSQPGGNFGFNGLHGFVDNTRSHEYCLTPRHISPSFSIGRTSGSQQ
jgi:hypothetical protein